MENNLSFNRGRNIPNLLEISEVIICFIIWILCCAWLIFALLERKKEPHLKNCSWNASPCRAIVIYYSICKPPFLKVRVAQNQGRVQRLRATKHPFFQMEFLRKKTGRNRINVFSKMDQTNWEKNGGWWKCSRTMTNTWQESKDRCSERESERRGSQT